MFKKASLKILARDSTTSNGGRDTKPMHTLISAEKAILLSLQKLSIDYAKAADALRNWGVSETGDLGGILTASTTLLNHFSLALSQYVAHGHTMQRQLEAISTRGDSLDNLKQRRHDAHRKAQDTSNQLSKMDPQNKYFSMHTDALRRLRNDVLKLEAEIKLEDAAFSDFKRTTTKVWMTLKFSGLRDCCEKGMIAGKYGKLASTEISEETTQSDIPRTPISTNKVDNLLLEADRDVNAVGQNISSVRSPDNIPNRSNSPRPSNISSHSSYVSPQRTSEEPPHHSPPQLPPKPPSQQNDTNYHQAARPFQGGNGHFSERVDPSFASSSGHWPHAPPRQTQRSQGTVNSSNGILSDRFLTSPAQMHPPVAPDSGGYPFPPPSLNGRGNSPQDPITTRPSGSSEPGGYASQDPRSLAGHQRQGDSSFPPGRSQWQNQPPSLGGHHQNSESSTSHWQNPSSDQFPTHPRSPPPLSESGRYPQDPPSLGRRRPTNDSSSSTGSSHWQNSPSDQFLTPPRPRGSSNSGRYSPQDPPPSGGPNRVGDPSLSAGPSHFSDRFPSPSRPHGSSESGGYPSQDTPHLGGRYSNDNSSYTTGKSHLQVPIVMSPPGSSQSGGYDSRSLDGRYQDRSSLSESVAGTSQWATNRLSDGSEGTTRGREGSYSHPMNSWSNPSACTNPDDSPPAYRAKDLGHQDLLPDTAFK